MERNAKNHQIIVYDGNECVRKEEMKISYRKKRLIVGITMMYCFIGMAFQLEFFLKIAFKFDAWYTALGMLFLINWFMWVPTVMCIFLAYFILTKVYPYEEAK